MNQNVYDKAVIEFLQGGKEFFGWFQGKNTPNILMMIGEQLGRIEVALKAREQRPHVEEFAYVSANSVAELWAAVQRHMAEDWQPFGSVTVGLSSTNEQVFVQSVAKYREEITTIP